MNTNSYIFLFLQTAHQGPVFYYFICTVFTVRSTAHQTALEPGAGDLEAWTQPLDHHPPTTPQQKIDTFLPEVKYLKSKRNNVPSPGLVILLPLIRQSQFTV